MLNINDEKNCIELLDFSDRSVVLDRCAIIDNKEGMFEFALLAFDIDVDECNVMTSDNGEFYNPDSYWFFNGQDVTRFNYAEDGKCFGYTCDEFGVLFDEPKVNSSKNNLIAKLIGYNF